MNNNTRRPDTKPLILITSLAIIPIAVALGVALPDNHDAEISSILAQFAHTIAVATILLILAHATIGICIIAALASLYDAIRHHTATITQQPAKNPAETYPYIPKPTSNR